MKNRLILNLISWILIFTISYSQAAFAADARQMLLEAKSFFDEEASKQAQGSGYSQSQLQSAQSIQEAVVSQQQMLEDFQNTSFSLNTSSGEVLKYVGDKLDSVERPDGTKIANILTDTQGNIQKADLWLSDGSVQVYENGKVLAYQTPDGTRVFYDSLGQVQKTISKTGVETIYTVTRNAQNQVTETILTNPSHISKYDASGKIKEVFSKASGEKVIYSNGVPLKLIKADNTETVFQKNVLADGSYTVDFPFYSSPNGGGVDPNGAFLEAGGLLSINSSSYHLNTPGLDGRNWGVSSGYLVAQGPSMIDSLSIPASSARLDFKINVASAGTYYLWVSGFAPDIYSDSIHAGLNGVVSTLGTKMTGFAVNTDNAWTNKNASNQVVSIQIAAPGEHTLNIWMRETGFKLKKVVLTKDALFVPGGTGPAESQRTVISSSLALPFQESNGLLSLNSTSHFLNSSGTSGRVWSLSNGALTALGPVLSETANITAESPRLDFKFNIQSPGTYYVWVGGFAPDVYSDSIHLGINGVLSSTGTKVTGFAANTANAWTNKNGQNQVVSFQFSAAGEYTVNVWMREPNFRFQKLLLSKDAAFIPAGTGPAESLRVAVSSAAGESAYPKRITYDSFHKIKEMLLENGTRVVFSNDLPVHAYLPDGTLTAFNFSLSALANTVGSNVIQGNLTSNYDSQGRLKSIKLSDVTVHYNEDSSVDYLEKTDGTEIYDLVFNAAGSLTGALVISPDGEERSYVNGKLTAVARPDHTLLYYANDKLSKMVTPEKLNYIFSYAPSKIEAVLDSSSANLADSLTPRVIEYDAGFNLKKVTRQNSEILSYLNNELVQIDAPSQAAKVFNYTRDAQGKILSYTVTQGSVVTAYGADNQPVWAKINSNAENPHTLDIAYQYGKIREIKKNGVLTFKYSYAFLENQEQTLVEDLENNKLNTYVSDRLMSVLDKANNVQSAYEYLDQKTSKVTVSRFGRILHVYDYRYDASGNTLVFDETGVVRTYDAAKKLIFLEKEGIKYAYSYSTVLSGGSLAPQQTVLPITTLDTNYRTPNADPYQTWIVGSSDNSLYSFVSNVEAGYAVNLSQSGDLKIEFESKNHSASIPSTFSYQLDIYVDGVKKSTYMAPASAAYQANQLVLTGLSQGSHNIRIRWVNHYYVAGQYDSNFRFKNLKLTHLYQAPAQQPREIVTEEIKERKLSDASVAYYTNGEVSQIKYSDGRVLKNITKDADGNLLEARLYANDQDSVGIKINFSGKQISKVTLASGQALEYAYHLDSSGTVTQTSLKKGGAVLKYNAQNQLTGVRIAAVLEPGEVQSQTVHSYVGAGYGVLSTDGDFNTAFSETSSCSGCGGSGVYVESGHSFSFTQAQVIKDIRFRLAARGYAFGNYIRESSASYSVQVLVNNTWQTIPASFYGCSGGDGICEADSGIRNLLNLNLDNVQAIRATAQGFGNASGGEGNSGGSASIYEIQFTLQDLANLSYSEIKNGSGQVTGYHLTGYRGTAQFNASGALTQSVSAYALAQNELSGVIQNYSKNPYLNSDFDSLYTALADYETIVSEEFSLDGTLETQTQADGSVTLFDNNKPTHVLDKKGKVIIQYTYDPSGNPTRVYLKNARDSLPDEMIKAKQNIEAERAQTLRELSAGQNLAYQNIQTQYAAARQQAESNIVSLENQALSLSNQSAKGKEAKKAKAEGIDTINSQIGNARKALTDLMNNEADSYAALGAQIKVLSDQIEADSVKAVQDLGVQETNMKKEILRQEISPVVYDHYRRLLGRDPDTQEFNAWIAQIDYNSGNSLAESKTLGGQNLSSALTSSINSLSELSQRQAYVNTIKTGVLSAIDSYLAMSTQQKEAYALTLGLSASDLIPLSSSDALKIKNWLSTRSLHFGQSAFLALENLLEQKGKVFSRTELAKQAIMTDVLTGVISPLDDGDLVISVFSLNKTAKLYGLDLTAANVSWEDLKAVIPASGAGPRAIAHINGNHFVVLTAISNNSITYVDMGKGKDKQNESVTLSKEDFLKVFQGNATLNTSDYAPVAARAASNHSNSRILFAQETKNIRGAFLPLLVAAIWGALQSIGAVVWAVVNALGTILAGIGSLVANVVNGIGAVLSKLGEGLSYIGKGLFQGIKFAASTLSRVFGNPLATFNSQNLIGGITKAVFGDSLFKTAVNFGLSVAAQKGLEALGVNPVIANFATAFVSGGITGGFNAGFTAANFIKGGVKALALQGTQTVLQNANINSTLSQTLLTIASPFIDGIQSGNVGGAVVKIAKDLPKNLASVGMSSLGSSLGIDPRISSLIGTPIANGIGGFFSGAANAGQNLVNSINEGLIRGALAYGVDFAARNITDNAILQALSSRVISGAIEGVLIQGGNLFKGVYEALKQSILGAVGLGVDAAHFVSNAVNFASLVLQNGFSNALEIHLTSIFNRNTVESIYRSGGVASALLAPKQDVTLPDGTQARQSVLSTGEGILFDANNNLIGFQRNGLYQTGQFGIGSDGSFGLITGESFGILQTGQYYEALVQDGKVTQITTITSGVHLEINPDDETPSIRFDVDGNVSDGQVNLGDKITLTIANGTLDGIQIVNDLVNQTAAEAIKRAEDFSSFINQVFMLDGPQTTIYNGTNGIVAADMKLDWLNFMEKEKQALAISDLFSIQIANSRWLRAVNDAAPKIAALMQDSNNKFIFVPGVNTTIVDQIVNDAGRTMTQIQTLSESFDLSGKRVMFFHSAGTEAGLKSLLAAKQAGVDLSQFKFVFASPRVRRNTFVDYLNQAGVTSDQVLVVTAETDYPHFATDLFAPNPDLSDIQSFFPTLRDYENSGGRYNYLFLERDLTSEDSNGIITAQLGHGGMVDGAISDHEYQVTRNGSRIQRVRLRDLYFDFSNGSF